MSTPSLPTPKLPIDPSSSFSSVDHLVEKNGGVSANASPRSTTFLAPRFPSIAGRTSFYYDDSRYSFASTGSKLTSNIEEKFTLSPDPREWGSSLAPDLIEADDDIHNINAPEIPYHGSKKSNTDAFRRLAMEVDGHLWSKRGVANLGCLAVMIVGFIGLFAGFPIAMYATHTSLTNFGAFNMGGINASGQIPNMPGNRGLIDADTPTSAYTKSSWMDGSEMQLVFSDEFNVDGRTFYPGDDPYWEAVDLHYWETNNLEWYSPDAITTQDGSLVITLEQKVNHDLNYQGGMMQTWNKFCFTGGYIETSVELPGVNNVVGLWPAIWTMGNLGRAGYGASLQGLWPYSYDSCDVGTVANQSINGQPVAATVNGDQSVGGVLSYLPGQRLSRCTCSGESHPGPKHSDGTYVGRAAPEIDIFEAQITGAPLEGQVSQSAQWAPFDPGYLWQQNGSNIVDPTISELNTFVGSSTQEATSVVTETNQECYEGEQGCYSVYGFEYAPGFDNAYISWISNNQVAWTLDAAAMGADSATEISARPVSQEPMYIIANLGMSTNFGAVDLANLPFPVHMRVDYVRVYQKKGAINIGCDPKQFPTEKYINQYIDAYTNPNLTTWTGDYDQAWPKNSYLQQC